MNTVFWQSFHRELEKISSSFVQRNIPGLLQSNGLAGKYVNPANLAANPEAAAQFKVPEGKGLILMSNPEDFLQNAGGDPAKAQAMHNVMRRHELTHALRDKAGKMEGYGQPGLRNVLTTGREELIAHLEGLKRAVPFNDLLQGQAAAVIPGTVGSMRAAYPGGLRQAAMAGTLKPLAGLASKIGLLPGAR